MRRGGGLYDTLTAPVRLCTALQLMLGYGACTKVRSMHLHNLLCQLTHLSLHRAFPHLVQSNPVPTLSPMTLNGSTYLPNSFPFNSPPCTHPVPCYHIQPWPIPCTPLSLHRYIAACAPHIQEWLFYPPLRGAYDYVRLTRDNHLPNPSWLYSQGLSTVWDAKVCWGGRGERGDSAQT